MASKQQTGVKWTVGLLAVIALVIYVGFYFLMYRANG